MAQRSETSLLLAVSGQCEAHHEGSCSVYYKCPERGRRLVDHDEHASGLNHEKDFLLRRKTEACIIKVGDTRNHCHRGVPTQLHKTRSHASMLYCHLANSKVAYL